MKSYLQLAKEAYEAGQQAMRELGLPTAKTPPWEHLPDASKNVWVAVAKRLFAEFSAMH